MDAPKFWNKKTYISYLLSPATWLYQAGYCLKNYFTKPQKITKPIICVGNVAAGGAGKTPIAIEIGLILKELGVNFSFLSRGYGGNIEDFTLVKKDHVASQVGDEPLLLSEISDVFISKNRAFGASLISKMPEKELIIMDDGLQNPSIFKDYQILVIDGPYGFGNGFLIPAGPLRENYLNAINRSDLIIIIGEDKNNILNLCKNKKTVLAKIKPLNHHNFKDKKILAFCGIGRPEKFFNSLEEIGAKIVKTLSFSDHYQYLGSDIEQIIAMAQKNNAKVVTTKKDWVRLDRKYQNQIEYLDIRIEFNNRDFIENELKELLKK